MKATAAILKDVGRTFQVETIEIEPPRANEILVRIVGTGVCHTDVKMAEGYRPMPMPVVLGHEGAGIVEAVGSQVTKVQPGDRVVLSYNSCGLCANCQTGQAAYCDEVGPLSFSCKRPSDGSSPLSQNGAVVYGYFFGQSSFASYALTTERNVVKVTQDVPLEILGPLGCGIQTGAGAVLNALDPEPGSSIVIFGTGSVGLSAVMAAVIAGCTTIIAVDLNPQRLELAQSLGATHTLNPAETTGIVPAITEICGGGAAYTLDTTGNPNVLRQAVEALKILGVCGHLGGGGADVAIPMGHLLFGRTIQGIIQGSSVPDVFIPKLIDLYLSGRFPFDQLISFYPLANINEAIDDMHHGKVIKPVLKAM